MTAPAVQIEKLSHRYGQRVALRDISLTVPAGEIFGILGPNGSGKTSLFRIVSTLIPPSQPAAALSVLSHPLPDQRDALRREIAVVFQAPSLDKELSAAENLRHHGHLYGLSGRILRERINEVLEIFGVADRAGERVSRLSGGLRRRVELAKGMLTRPRLLLLDEPSTGLDPAARAQMWQQLDAARRGSGITVILTTHFMDEADRCDRVAIVDQGILVACDSPHNLKGRIGGEVITILTTDPANLCERLKTRLNVTPQIIGNTLRLEHANAHALVSPIIEAASGAIQAISVGRPTIKDVFMKLTGRRFADQVDDTGA